MHHRIGDLVSSVSSGIIVQQVNAQGRMGSGFARALFLKYPLVKARYHERIKMNQYHRGYDYMGDCDLFEVQTNLYVANIVGQQYFGNDGKRYTSYDALDRGLESLAKQLKNPTHPLNTIGSLEPFQIHHPLIGAGLGGGAWSIISPMISEHLGHDTTLWTLA